MGFNTPEVRIDPPGTPRQRGHPLLHLGSESQMASSRLPRPGVWDVSEVDIAPDATATMDAWNLTTHLGESYAPHISPVIPTIEREQTPS